MLRLYFVILGLLQAGEAVAPFGVGVEGTGLLGREVFKPHGRLRNRVFRFVQNHADQDFCRRRFFLFGVELIRTPREEYGDESPRP